MGYGNITADLKAEVIAEKRRDPYRSLQSLAHEFGVCRHSVYKILKEAEEVL